MNGLIATRVYAILAFMLVTGFTDAGVYKCKMPDGSIKYQEMPCETSSPSEIVDVPDDSSGSSLNPAYDPYSVMNQAMDLEVKEAAERRARAQRAAEAAANAGPSSLEIRNARVSDQVIRGMSPDDVRQSWGAPSSVYKGSGGYESWSYRRSYRGSYSSRTVIFNNGKVTNINSYDSK